MKIDGIVDSLDAGDLVEIRQALYGALNHINLYHKEEAESVIEDINHSLGLIEGDSK